MTIDSTHLTAVTDFDFPSASFENGLISGINNLKDNATDKTAGAFTADNLELNTDKASITESGVKFWLGGASDFVRLLFDKGAGFFKLLDDSSTLQALSLADGTDPTHAVTLAQLDDTNDRIDNLVTVPTGAILEWPAAALPSGGYVWANGDSVLRTAYPALFALFGTTYGSVDSSHFTLPDRRQRVSIGTGTMGSSTDPARVSAASTGGANANTLGGVGGEETHTVTISELPSHNFTVKALSGGSSPGFAQNNLAGAIQGASLTSNTVGSDSPASNTQPWIALNFIIKT